MMGGNNASQATQMVSRNGGVIGIPGKQNLFRAVFQFSQEGK